MLTCDHCLVAFPERDAVYGEIKGVKKVFCCHGCQGVYRLINNEGLDAFYRRRQAWTPGPVSPVLPDPAAFAANVRTIGEEQETDLVLDGIRCASCVWLNEKILTRTPGVTFAQVNYATHRARVRWDPARIGIGAILDRIASIGYTPKPFVATAFEEQQRKESRDLLIRFGTAGFLASQLMLFSIALYAGYFQGMDVRSKMLFDVLSLAVATPVIFYAGWPFLAGAARGMRHFTFNMDFLIAAGAGSAYLYSIYQMAIGGAVYFDTAVMIVTLILLGRLIESGAKRKASEVIARLVSLAPAEARVVVPGEALGAERRMTAIAAIQVGDLVETIPGEKVPLDGIVREGRTEVDESMLTGESRPVSKEQGAEVFGGTLNLHGRIVVEVTRTGDETVLARIIRAVEDAQAQRAPVQALADRVVGVFVPVVLLLSLSTAAYWLLSGHPFSTALMNAVSVLVIACPCSLGLATPLAILIGTTYGASQGILIKGGDVIERAGKVSVVLFDKTGTITMGRPSLVLARGIGRSDEEALRIAASLERWSEHSLGRALCAAAPELPLAEPEGFAAVPGRGVRGTIGGAEALVGSREFIEHEGIGQPLDEAEASFADTHEAQGVTIVYLSLGNELAGVFGIADAERPEAAEAIARLRRSGMETVMLTGDAPGTATAIADRVGIRDVRAKRSPVQKAEEVRALRAAGKACIMVGDGVNDAPALVQADVGIAMGRATDIALESADMVLMRSDLRLVPRAVALAKKTFAVIRQNLFWALFYNAVALPLAVTGLLHPIFAAGAMAMSSLSVVGNSLRARVR